MVVGFGPRPEKGLLILALSGLIWRFLSAGRLVLPLLQVCRAIQFHRLYACECNAHSNGLMRAAAGCDLLLAALGPYLSRRSQ